MSASVWSPFNGGPYYGGYLSGFWGIHRLCNPWHPWVYPGPRMAWACGHFDALEDARPGVQPRLQAEFEAQ